MKAKEYKAQQQKQFPDQPWMWDKQWENGQAKSSDKVAFYFFLVFALIWNAMSWPIVPDILRDAKHKPEAYIALLFPAIGLMLAVWAFKFYIKYRKFGRSVLHFHTMPGVIGGAFEGEVIIPSAVNPEKGFEVTVNCVNYRASRGKNSSSSRSIMWQRTMKVRGEVIRAREVSTVVPIYCAIPFGKASTSEPNKYGDHVYWEVVVKAEIPGVDVSSQFTIPVYQTPESSEAFVADEQKMREIVFDPHVTDSDILAEEGIVEERNMGRWSLHFPAGRHKQGSKILFLFAVAIVAIPIGLLAKFGLQIPIFAACFIGFMVFIFAWVMWYIWLMQVCYRSTISVENGVVKIRAGALKMKEVTLALDDVKSIRDRAGMQTNDSLYFRIILRGSDDKPHQVAAQIPGAEMTDIIIKKLKEELGVVDKR